jgi:zinc transport system substrate-binding protein
LLLSLALASTSALADADQTLKVFVSVLPVQTFVDRVGDSRVETEVMVLPGQSPATYDPSPKQIAALANADLYVRVGVPFEDAWMPRIRAANPTMPVLDLRDGLRLRQQEQHDHGSDHQHPRGDGAEIDPHVWTSPANARAMLHSIRDTLTGLDPAGTPTYAANQQGYDAELAALDAALADILAGLDNRTFLVYHPAWGYFADAYGLEQVTIERAGKEPGPRRLAALIDQAKATGTRAIFVQPEFDRRTAQQVARSIGGRVEVATPLAADYAANLKRFAAILADANRHAMHDRAAPGQ